MRHLRLIASILTIGTAGALILAATDRHSPAGEVIRVSRTTRVLVRPAWRPEPALRPDVSYVGTVTTVANFSGQQTNGVAYDTDNAQFYVLEGWTLYQLESNGQTTQVANFNDYGYPNAIVWDANTHLFYVSCPSRYELVSASAAGATAVLAGGSHGTADGVGRNASFQYPSGIGLDPVNHVLYVADQDRMRQVTEGGKVVTVGPVGVLSGSYFGQAYGVAFDTTTQVVGIADPPAQAVLAFNPTSATYQTIAGRCVVVSNQSGCASLFADGPDADALFAEPSAIAYDPASNAFYVADQSNDMLRRVQTSGSVKRIAGDGQSTVVDGVDLGAGFSGPSCAMLDPTTGNIWVCDGNGTLLRVVTTSGATPPLPPHALEMRLAPTIYSQPSGLARTADGSLWFSEHASGYIGRFLPNRTIHEYVLPGGFGLPFGASSAPDGGVLFTDYSAFSQYGNPAQADIGEIGTDGAISERAFPNECPYNSPSYPSFLTSDPVGDIWFAGTCPSSIGFESPQHALTQFVAPQLGGIAIGPGPEIWTGDAQNLFEYSDTGALLAAYSVAADGGVTIGPDKTIWVLSDAFQSISSVNPGNGAITTYQLPSCNCSTRNLGSPAFGPDGELWFTEGGNSTYDAYPGMIGRLSVKGRFDEFPTYEPRSQPSGMTFDASGDLWISDFGADKIGRML